MWKELGRWPLILAAVICIGLGSRLAYLEPGGGETVAVVLLVLGSLCLGAFLAVYFIEHRKHNGHDDKE